MEPVSSTVESVPMYKLAKKLSYDFDDLEGYEKNELLTGRQGLENVGLSGPFSQLVKLIY